MADVHLVYAQPVTEIQALNRLCTDELDRGDLERAAVVCKRINQQVSKLAPGSDAELSSLFNVAEIKKRQNNAPDAEELYAAALALLVQTGRGQTERAAVALEKQAEARIAIGRVFDAEPLLRQAVTIREAVNGATALQAADVRVKHAAVLGTLAQFHEAHITYRRALAVYERAGPTARDRYLDTRRRIAELLSIQSRFEQAEVEYRKLLDEANSPPRVSSLVALSLGRLGWIADETGRQEEAIELYRRAIAEYPPSDVGSESARRLQERLVALLAVTAPAQ